MRPKSSHRFVIGLLLILAPTTARAVSQSGGIALQFDPSVRATGMGGAGAAVAWGDDPDYWANPALLGYYEGVRYQYGKTQLARGLADDVFLTSHRFSMGGYGIGVAFAGKPVDTIGGIRLDQGTQEGTDIDGNPTEFEAFQDIESFSIGVSVSRLTHAVFAARGLEPPSFLRYGDVALGFAQKDLVDVLAPDELVTTGEGMGRTSSQDVGIFVRAIPYDTFDPARTQDQPDVPLRAELGFGYSIQNENDVEIIFAESQVDPIGRYPRRGFAGRVSMGRPSAFGIGADSPWVGPSTPLISVGGAYDVYEEQIPTERDEEGEVTNRSSSSEITQYGLEITLLNMVSLRRGHVDDPEGDIVDGTWGVGLGFQYEDILGFRWDYAENPQASGLPNVSRNAFTVVLRPIELYEKIRSR